ncbi:hypothetical protein [Gordonia insulae]|uniref:Uncharacterized protein n=1 Tax=Gordonia insulae TaxID=2420509 RepID=A0A3G8JMM4_9ACTN|nr:hypothetical protein [Gordonia insulae]AZG45709.1 hypothetical protein D7316_02309 [Gordonia insulae]
MTTTIDRPENVGTMPVEVRPTPGRILITLPDLAMMSAVAGLLGLLPLPAPLSALLVAVFALIGPGAALLTWVDFPRRARPAAVLTLSMAVTTLVPIAAMWSYRWNPVGILVFPALGVLGSSALFYFRSSTRPAPAQWWSHVADRVRTSGHALRGLPAALIAVALILWLIALPSLPGADASLYGLTFSGSGRLLIPAMAAVVVAFVVAVVGRNSAAAVAALGAAIVVSRFTVWLGTEVPLYDWTYKHVAVVRYILVNDLIQPDGTDIYAQWPAFFVSSAWFCDVTGLNPMTLAHVFAPVVHVLIAVVVYSAARVIGSSRRVALTAAFVVELVNWVGQDYFSPQAWAVVLAYGFLTMLLASRDAPRAGVLAIVPFAAMVPTHQLTPFWALGAAVLLVVFRQARPWWAVLIMIAIAAAYLALNFSAVAPYGIFTGGNPVENAAGNVTATGAPDAARTLTSWVVRGLSAGVMGVAGLCFLVGWRRHRRRVWGLAIIAFSALGLLLAQSYGGEAIFRIYLYSLLGCGLLIAPVLVAALDGFRSGRHRRVVALVASAGLLGVGSAGLYSYLALWPLVVQTSSQIAVMDRITAAAEPGTRFTMMKQGGVPTRLNDNYAPLTLADPYFDGALTFAFPDATRPDFPTEEQLGYLRWNVEQHNGPTYVIFSEQARRAMQYYGEYGPESIGRFQSALQNTSGWNLVYANGETKIFRFDPR